jgi:hypothetical protein
MSYQSRLDDVNYYRDPRTTAKRRGSWYDHFDSHSMRCIITVWDYDHDHDESDIEVSAWIAVHYEVCDLCNGRGSHVNPSIDSGGISSEDFDYDPDFEEDYRRGVHDVPCYQCGGRRVEPVPNDPQPTEEQTRLLKVLRENQEDEAAHEAEVAAELRWGC